MFTGIIRKTSKVAKVKPAQGGLILQIVNNLGKLKSGESVSVNGVCSTVKKCDEDIVFEYMPETLERSNIDALGQNDLVNMEQSMRLGDRLDGHIVLGHIDAKAEVIRIQKEGNSKVFEIEIPDKKHRAFLVEKGSIAVEGISLTIAKVSKHSFLVKIIPYTLEQTNLKLKKEGDFLNLEFDILAKYANKKQAKT